MSSHMVETLLGCSTRWGTYSNVDYRNRGCDIRNDTEIYDSDTISLQ